MAEIISNSKLEYLAKMFSRAQKKAYENYVITSIYQKVGNYELQPVTQQLVRVKESNKYYLLDLYFPQIEYGVEIDEPTHEREEYKEKDMKRASDILNAINCDEKHVIIEDDYDLDSVNKQIAERVKEINELISIKGPLKWETNETKKERAFKNKRIRVRDGIGYKNFSEIWEKITGEHLNNNSRCYFKTKLLPGGYHLWVPKLTIDVNGKRIGDPKWTNVMNKGRNRIEESAANRKTLLKKGPVLDGEKRVVFMQTRNEFNSRIIEFVGVFQHTDNKDSETAVYSRITEEYTW